MVMLLEGRHLQFFVYKKLDSSSDVCDDQLQGFPLHVNYNITLVIYYSWTFCGMCIYENSHAADCNTTAHAPALFISENPILSALL